jgi:hypothetical protein
MDKITECGFKTNYKKKTCDKYLDGGMCAKDNMFRCTEYMQRVEPRLSHSGIMNFIRCPQMYYYSNVRGLQLISCFHGDPLKIGASVDDYITNILLGGEPTENTVYLGGEITTMWEAKTIGIINAFNKLVDTAKVRQYFQGQREFLIQEDGQPSIKGFIDLHSKSGKQFIELKCGKNPAYYTNLFYIESKLAAYFMSLETYKVGIVWAIRVPQLKLLEGKKKEELDDYAARITEVMVGQPRHYFPGYNYKSKSFGVRFSRAEIDLETAKKNYRMVADWIRLCAKRDVWPKNGTGCLHPFECDYLHICENFGNISDDVYSYREKETRKGKMQA